MLRKISLICLIVILSYSCATTIPLSQNYFQSKKKVGLLLRVSKISKMRTGSQGLLDLALTSGDKFKIPLETIEPKINAKEKFNSLYTNIFSQKGKQMIVLNETSKDSIDKNLKKFVKPTDSGGKKYFKYDMRFMKAKYGIDELLVSDVNYGILVSYYSMIEIGKNGHAVLSTVIVNLDDNSLLYSNPSTATTEIKGKWNVAPYNDLENSINEAINLTIEQEKNKIK
jgi:hypothetical protein